MILLTKNRELTLRIIQEAIKTNGMNIINLIQIDVNIKIYSRDEYKSNH